MNQPTIPNGDINKLPLNYSMRVNTIKILNLNVEIKNIKNNLNVAYTFTAILLLITIYNLDTYSGFLSHYITGAGVYKRVPGILDMLLLFALIVCIYFVFTYSEKISNIKNSFEKIRINIIDNIGKGLCDCHDTCSCKEEYTRLMYEQEHIDITCK